MKNSSHDKVPACQTEYIIREREYGIGYVRSKNRGD
jgi:hypothetical protein